jgi:hypothetical protein
MREKIRMNSSAGTGHFYTTDKNKRTTPDKLQGRQDQVTADLLPNGDEPRFYRGFFMPMDGPAGVPGYSATAMDGGSGVCEYMPHHA